jgi:diguanylate cyclase (GGDEF)-like protein
MNGEWSGGNMTESGFFEKLQALRQSYIQQLSGKLEAIEQAWQAVCIQDSQQETLELFHRQVHSIAGSSATHGLTEVSEIAREIELLVQYALEQSSTLSPEQSLHIHSLLYKLRQVIFGDTSMVKDAAVPPPPVVSSPVLPEHPPPVVEPVSPTIHDEPQRWSVASRQLVKEQNNRLIFLVEDDEELAHDLSLQIGHFGYNVRIFANPEAIKQAMVSTQPAAIVMDVVFPEGQLAGVETIAAIQQSSYQHIPVLFMSARDDVAARLQAVRAGGLAYHTKPVNVPALIDKLDELTTETKPEPYRVLIVDDDPSVAEYYRVVLEQSEIICYVINNPMDVLHPLLDFQPDLILMDMYMPQCTGRELASVIRQQEAYVGIPIVFLSTETNIEKQLTAMHEGRGDDFLTKSIKADHFVSIVKNRAHRSRVLRDSMVRDSLTGLYNHTTTKEHLRREVAFARRRNASIAFAMIDLDKFKTVNDTYGHPTGDRVLKNLSRVLQQRLRKTDIIGRYGGEEFAVMLPDTDGQDAVRVLDSIREDFAQVRQRTENAEFHATFSCGIADYPSYTEATIINKAADEALYQAKRQGRNTVILAKPPV